MSKEMQQKQFFRIFAENKDSEPYCFILGAGASVQSGVKSGGALAKIWLGELREDDPTNARKLITKHGIDENNPGEHYTAIYEARFPANPYGVSKTGYKYLQKEIENKVPSCGYYHLAMILTETASNVVITTNFDRFIEESIHDYTNKRPLRIHHENMAKLIDISDNSKIPIIIKIHRDMLLQPLSSPSSCEYLNDQWIELLESVFKKYTPVVIGYGGNDGGFMQFLNKYANDDKGLYWCHLQNEKLPNKITNLVEKVKGLFVPIDSFDEAMVMLGNKLNHEEATNIIKKNVERKIESYNKTRKKLKLTQEPTNTNEAVNSHIIDKAVIESQIKTLEEENIKSAEWHYQIGEKHQSICNYDQAFVNKNLAVKKDINNPKYLLSRGECRLHFNGENKYEEALKDTTKAIDIAEAAENIDGHYYMVRAMIYDCLNDKQNADRDRRLAKKTGYIGSSEDS